MYYSCTRLHTKCSRDRLPALFDIDRQIQFTWATMSALLFEVELTRQTNTRWMTQASFCNSPTMTAIKFASNRCREIGVGRLLRPISTWKRTQNPRRAWGPNKEWISSSERRIAHTIVVPSLRAAAVVNISAGGCLSCKFC